MGLATLKAHQIGALQYPHTPSRRLKRPPKCGIILEDGAARILHNPLHQQRLPRERSEEPIAIGIHLCSFQEFKVCLIKSVEHKERSPLGMPEGLCSFHNL